MVVRDVIAHFAVAVDDSQLTKMDRSLNRLKDKVKKFAVGTAAAFAAAGYAGYKLVDAASHADEALNVLQATFKQNSDEVLKWSKTVADAMGRSEYEFQDAAGKFGAFMTPIFRGTNQDIALMSKQLSELAVDLASFYNTTDQEATMRLFSGMSGETEAVRRYGIDISDASLDAFNKSQGDNRTMRSLSMKEKSLLRYRKILMDTELAQGDAEKTADSWANQVRRMQSNIKTIAVDMGRALMPAAKKVLTWLNKIVKVAADWRNVVLKITSVFNTIITMGGLYVGIWAILNRQLLLGLAYMVKFSWESANMTNRLKAAAGQAALIAASFLAIEDVYSFLSGQKSILGDTIAAATGTADPLKKSKRSAHDIMISLRNGAQYMVNAAVLLTKMPEIIHKLANGDVKGATKLRQDVMGYGIRDTDAENAASDAARKKSFDAWVAKGGQEGLEGARKEGNRGFDEDQQQAELRFMKERQALIARALKNRPDLLGSLSAGSVLGKSNGQQVSVSSEDILQGFVPQKYMKNQSLQDAATYTQGEVKIGEVKVYVGGGLGQTEADKVADRFIKAVDKAAKNRKK